MNSSSSAPKCPCPRLPSQPPSTHPEASLPLLSIFRLACRPLIFPGVFICRSTGSILGARPVGITTPRPKQTLRQAASLCGLNGVGPRGTGWGGVPVGGEGRCILEQRRYGGQLGLMPPGALGGRGQRACILPEGQELGCSSANTGHTPTAPHACLRYHGRAPRARSHSAWSTCKRGCSSDLNKAGSGLALTTQS